VGFPTTLFYDAQGRLRLRHVGELSEATLREKLAALGR
jgi:thiol:disulfide interchange protein